MEKKDASVIVPTYNRVHRIRNLMAYLNRQDQGNFEVVVVSDGSNDGTIEWLKYCFLCGWFHHDLIICDTKFDGERLRFDNGNGVLVGTGGEVKARNIGIKFASSDLLIFTDDDCFMHENWIREYVAASNRKNDKRVFTAPIRFVSEKWPKKQQFIADDLRGKDMREFTGFVTNNINRTYTICGANFAVDRQLATDIGGFDMAFMSIGGCDTEFGSRLHMINDGVTPVDAPVFHLGLTANHIDPKRLMHGIQQTRNVYRQKKPIVIRNGGNKFFQQDSWQKYLVAEYRHESK